MDLERRPPRRLGRLGDPALTRPAPCCVRLSSGHGSIPAYPARARGGSELPRAHTWKDNDVEAAITQHLIRLLNTRQGSCLTCPDYGLVEISELLFEFPDAVGIMQRAIKNAIQSYEPRLKNVQVRHVKSEETNA